MDAYEHTKRCLFAALEVFLLFFAFVFSQALVTLVLVLPYVFAMITRLLAQDMGPNQAAVEVTRLITEDFLPRHTVTVSILSSLLSVLGLLLIYRKLHPPVKESLLLNKSPRSGFAPLLPLGVGLQLFISILLFWVIRLPGMGEHAAQMQEYSTLISGGGNRLLELFSVVVAAPLCEELFFRGAIPSALKRVGMPLWATIGIQAALFGLVHGLPLQMAYAFLIGILFGCLTEKHGCLWHSILLHALFNATGYWSELFTDAPDWLFVFLFLCAAVICAATLIAIFFPKSKGESHAT